MTYVVLGKKMKTNGFTMAEAIIVMTILGIIATIMITNLKPAEYRDTALLVQAKKILNNIDEATNQILINNSFDGTMKTLYIPNTSTMFEFKDTCNHVANLYQIYLVKTRKNYKEVNLNDGGNYIWGMKTNGTADGFKYQKGFILKDGSFIGITCRQNDGDRTCFPGETSIKETVDDIQGRIIFDVNGEDEPNIPCKDIFAFSINNQGLVYDK